MPGPSAARGTHRTRSVGLASSWTGSSIPGEPGRAAPGRSAARRRSCALPRREPRRRRGPNRYRSRRKWLAPKSAVSFSRQMCRRAAAPRCRGRASCAASTRSSGSRAAAARRRSIAVALDRVDDRLLHARGAREVDLAEVQLLDGIVQEHHVVPAEQLLRPPRKAGGEFEAGEAVDDCRPPSSGREAGARAGGAPVRRSAAANQSTACPRSPPGAGSRGALRGASTRTCPAAPARAVHVRSPANSDCLSALRSCRAPRPRTALSHVQNRRSSRSDRSAERPFAETSFSANGASGLGRPVPRRVQLPLRERRSVAQEHERRRQAHLPRLSDRTSSPGALSRSLISWRMLTKSGLYMSGSSSPSHTSPVST